jgi:hypothetical protein
MFYLGVKGMCKTMFLHFLPVDGHHLPALISSYLAGDNTLSKILPTTKDLTILLALMLTLCIPMMAMSISFGEFPLKRQPKSVGAS